MTQPRPIDLPAACLLAVAALALAVAAGCAVLLVALVGVAGRDAVALAGGGWEAGCAAAAVACATVAALMALTRPAGGLHPVALAAVWAAGFAWPLAGAPVPAAAAALAVTALALRLAPRTPRRRDDAPAAAALMALALGLLLVAALGTPLRSVQAIAAPSTSIDANVPDGETFATLDRPGPREARRQVAARVPGPAATVRAYYRALNAREFDRAAAHLSPGVLAAFGGAATWRDGFATTVASTPGDVEAATDGRSATVRLVLTATDRADCGIATQRFAIAWTLERTGAGWRATDVSGTPLTDRVC